MPRHYSHEETLVLLKRWKKQLKVETDDDLAKELGISPPTVSTWRNGSRSPYKFIEKYMKILAENEKLKAKKE